jgi:hypothetical protein
MSRQEPGHGTDDAERTALVGRLDRVVTKRDDAGRVLAADPIMALPCFDRRKVGAGRSGQDNGIWPQGVESAAQ